MCLTKEFKESKQRQSLEPIYLLFISLLWIITSVNSLPDNLHLHFVFSFLSFIFFPLKLPMSNSKRWSPILVSHSVLIQFKENYLLCFQGCGFSIQKKYKSHFPFSRYSKSCVEGKAEQRTCLSEREDMITAKMNYMDKRCYRVPQMPRLGEKNHSLLAKGRVLILIVCWHVVVSLTRQPTQSSSPGFVCWSWGDQAHTRIWALKARCSPGWPSVSVLLCSTGKVQCDSGCSQRLAPEMLLGQSPELAQIFTPNAFWKL